MYGCGADDCIECYPLVYQCECGYEFDPPVPNGGPEPDHECLEDDDGEEAR